MHAQGEEGGTLNHGEGSASMVKMLVHAGRGKVGVQ